MPAARLSAGLVLVHPEDCRFLILRAYRNWDFPKGIVESNETPLQAARRETAEETGIRELTFPYGLDYRETLPYNHGKIPRFYVARARTADVTLPVNPPLGRPEHHEYRWADLDTAMHLLPDRLRTVLTWASGLSGCDAP